MAALGGIAVWLAQNVGGKILSHLTARSGRVGYAPRDCGFFAESITDDGRKVIGRYFPDNMFKEEKVLPLRCSGDLYNDTDVAVLLTKPEVMFFRPTGPTIRQRPRLFVGQEEPAVVTVPAHGRCAIVLILDIHRKHLGEMYESTIPVLEMTDVNGRKRNFRLASTSFHGSRIAAWPRKGDLPVYVFDSKDDEKAETDEVRALPGEPPQAATLRDTSAVREGQRDSE